MITFLNEDLFWASAQLMADALWGLLVESFITFNSGVDAIVYALLELAISIVAIALCIMMHAPVFLSSPSAEGCCGVKSIESGSPESLDDVVIDLAPTAETFDAIVVGVTGITQALKAFTVDWIAPFAPSIGDIIGLFADALDNANLCLP